MSDKQVLEHNLFANDGLSDDKLVELFTALKCFYANGYIEDISPLHQYADRYKNCGLYQPGLHLVAMEKDLLSLMAIRFIQVVN